MNRILLPLCLLAFLLAGCNRAPAMQPPQPGKQLHDSEAVIPEATGSLLLPERLLPTGVLEVGREDAPLTLSVFTEHHCRYCRQFQIEQYPLLLNDFGTQGKLRIETSIYPLEKYPNSPDAAKGLYCAAKQNKGMDMHLLLFERQNKHRTSLVSYAEELGLDTAVFTTCLDDEATAATLSEQKKLATDAGVEYVPTFFLNGKKIVGLQYYADLRARIEQAVRNLE